MAAPGRSWTDRLLLVGAALAIFGGGVAFALYTSRWPEWVQQLVDTNPAWEVGRPSNVWLTVTERSTGASLRLAEREAGPYVLARVPCDEMMKAAPPWFRTPPDTSAAPAPACIRLTAPGREVYVTNFHTTLEVPEIWEDFYEPLTNDYDYGSSGGGSTALRRKSELPASAASAGAGTNDPPPPATDSRRFGNVISYKVSANKIEDGRDTHLAAFYVDGRATVVVAFRKLAP